MKMLFACSRLIMAAICVMGLTLAGCSTPVSLGNVFPGGEENAESATPEVVATPNTVTFEPFVGMPDSIASAFGTQLSQEAAGRQMRVVPPSDTTAAIRASGSFDAQRVGRETIITYIWDLKDQNGKQRSRFGGERKVSRTASDPWSVVGDQEIGAIASRIIDEIQRVNGNPL